MDRFPRIVPRIGAHSYWSIARNFLHLRDGRDIVLPAGCGPRRLLVLCCADNVCHSVTDRRFSIPTKGDSKKSNQGMVPFNR